MRRAGLDYHEFTAMRVHPDWDSFLADEQPGATLRPQHPRAARRFTIAASSRATGWFSASESAGMPPAGEAKLSARNRPCGCPMRPANRSMNLSNAVAIVVYEAWRQNGFAGGG